MQWRGGQIVETKDTIKFEINGNEFENVNRFRKQHESCSKGMAFDKFSYTFTPTSMGVLASIKCSCGQTMNFGNFSDNCSNDYDEEKYKVLTEEDKDNRKFEEAVRIVLQMNNPRIFRVMFLSEQSFEKVYTVAVSIAMVADERLRKCILYKNGRGENGEIIDNYKGRSEIEKLQEFYRYFEEHVRVELDRYGCDDERIYELLK